MSLVSIIWIAKDKGRAKKRQRNSFTYHSCTQKKTKATLGWGSIVPACMGYENVMHFSELAFTTLIVLLVNKKR